MEKVINNRNCILFTIFFSLILIIGLTIYKVYDTHLKRNFSVVEKRIIEGAKECVWDEVCTEDKITLGELITLGYAKEEVNPQTKMYYTHNSYVLIENNNYSFHEENS